MSLTEQENLFNFLNRLKNNMVLYYELDDLNEKWWTFLK